MKSAEFSADQKQLVIWRQVTKASQSSITPDQVAEKRTTFQATLTFELPPSLMVMEQKIGCCKILSCLCIPSLPHTQLSTLPQQLTVVFHESHYPVIIDPSGLQSTAELYL